MVKNTVRVLVTVILPMASMSLACHIENGHDRLEITGRGTDGPSAMCRDFRLTQKQVEEFFAKAEPITAQQMHDNYDYLPCWVAGKREGAKGTYSWKIHPVGIAKTQAANGVEQILGCKGCDNLFK